jgi:hypothetical protein
MLQSRSGVAYVAMAIHACCKCMFKYFSCFKHMLQVFYLDIAYVAVAIYICYKSMFFLDHAKGLRVFVLR